MPQKIHEYLRELDIAKIPQRYRTKFLRKRSGGKREINDPIELLKVIQRNIHSILKTPSTLVKTPFGIVSYRLLAPVPFILTLIRILTIKYKPQAFGMLDLKDFYHQVTPGKLLSALRKQSYFHFLHHDIIYDNVVKQGLWEKLAYILFYKNRLPQGAPTSSLFAEIAFLPTEFTLRLLLKKRDTFIIRYSDNIILLFGQQTNPEQTLEFTYSFLKEKGWTINDEKRVISQDMIFLGFRLRVNGELIPTRKFKRLIKLILFKHDIIGETPREIVTSIASSKHEQKVLMGKLAFAIQSNDPEWASKAQRALEILKQYKLSV